MFPHKQSSDSSSVSEEKNQLPIKNQSFLQSNFLVNFLVNFANPLFSPLSSAVSSAVCSALSGEPRLEAFSVPLFLPP